MQFRTLFLTAATLAAIAPSISNASPETDALQTCVQAFAASLASPGAAAPSYKLAYHAEQESSTLSYYSNSHYTFYLQARSSKTGLPMARATCSSNGGAVTALSATPLGPESPALAAQF